MRIIVFKTENAVLEFYRKDVLEHLNLLSTKHDGDETFRLLKFISNASGETILIQTEHDHFGYIALELIAAEKGSVTCTACGKTYKAGQIKPITVGHGRSPFDVTLIKKGGINSLFRKKPKMPAMFGGKGYRCPEGHELISLITWQT
jgi:hypothetical protein